MRTILAPLDGSALAEQVLPYVRQLAPALGAKIRLLHVITDVDREGIITSGAISRHGASDKLVTYGDLEQQAWDLLRTNAEIYLESQAAPLRASGLDVEVESLIGIPREQIVAAAAREPGTLVAMATHGYGGLRRWALGSVADSVARVVSAPVLIVRSGVYEASDPVIKRILVPLDGSDLARSALPLALELAGCEQAELILLQVVDLPTPYPGVTMLRRNQAAQELLELASGLPPQLPVTPVVAIGHAAEAIVDEAERRAVDLIVMATHGYGGLRRWALGSVADKVLHASSAPILLVRADPAD